MKNLQKLFSMAMLVCLTVTLFSCSKDEEEAVFAEADIMGSWTITQTEGDDDSFNFYQKKTTFEFMEDSKYTANKKFNGVEYSQEGTWELKDGKTLILTDEDGEEEMFIVQSLNGETAVFVSSGMPNLPGASTIEVEGGIRETFTLGKEE